MGSVAAVQVETEALFGPDPITAYLGVLAASFEDVQQTRKASQQRGMDSLADSLKKIEAQLSRELKKTLKTHPLWPFLEPLKGLSGPLTARLIAKVGDPLTFPGQRCSEGHYHRPIFEVGAPCPVYRYEGDEHRGAAADIVFASESRGGCTGIMLPPRTTTGVRSFWHWSGLHVVDGRLPKRRKGVQCDWNPAARTLALGPDGLADQIVKHQTSPYIEKYYAVKERLGAPADPAVESERFGGGAPDSEGGVATAGENECRVGPSLGFAEGVERGGESECRSGPLRPFQIHQRARTIAVKAFMGDLIVAWKQVAA